MYACNKFVTHSMKYDMFEDFLKEFSKRIKGLYGFFTRTCLKNILQEYV